MKAQDQYLKFVRWEADDGFYVGYCPDLFPWGGVCHGASEHATYQQLCELVAGEVEELRQQGKPLPPPSTRPMREVMPV
jgi:predicted RNase H-like HicB family nuclease